MDNKEMLVRVYAAIPTATPETLAKIADLLEGKPAALPDPADRRLLTFGETAKELNVSRQTVWRMTLEGRLPTVEIRPGTRRVPSAAITALLKGGAA